mmetsp:Transcript_7402/g.16726  ORF Transcript_7402/g.16726 Transcript_7402/m.16726 type:complete len:262 (-) Transcript_7402:188-973(-)
MRFDLGKLELCVVGIHGHELIPRRGAQHLDDLHQLVHPTFTREYRLAEHKFGRHASSRPNIDYSRVICGTKDELRSPVVTRADIGNIRFALHQTLGRSEVAKFEGVCAPIHQEVLRFDVAMTNANSMYVSAAASHLVGVQLNKYLRNGLLHFVVVLHHTVHCIGTVLHHDIQVCFSWFLARSIEGMFQLDDIGMSQFLHYLKLTILVALVLEDLLDGNRLACLHDLCLVDDPEGTTAQHAFRIVSEGWFLGAISRRGTAIG